MNRLADIIDDIQARQEEKKPFALRGDWRALAMVPGIDKGVDRKDVREALGWDRRKAGGVIAAMTEAELTRCSGSRVWLTHKGQAAKRETA